MIAEKGHDVTASHTTDPVRLRRSAAVRVGVALLTAGAATAIASVLVWGPLNVRTDVIGYPIFANFNPYNYYWTYGLTVGFFPIAALLIFIALTRVGPRLGLAVPPPRGRLRPLVPPVEADPALAEEPFLTEDWVAKRHAVAVVRVAFVGAVLGLEVGIASNHLWLSLLLVVLGYGAAIGLGSIALRRLNARWSTWDQRLAATNAVGATISVAGLALVSAHTEVHIFSTHSAQSYSWFPAWLGLPLCALLFGGLLVLLRRGGPASAVSIERRSLLLMAAPVALFLLVAHLPGDPGRIALFEEGQSLTETMLVGHGWLPWRDVVLTHGLLGDVAPIALGSAVFGNSYWGGLAGIDFFLIPIAILATYFLLTYLVGRSWPLLLITALIFVGTWLGAADPRFILWPVVLLLLAALLKRSTRVRAAALSFVVLAQAVVTPETAPAVLAVTIVVVAYEWYWRSTGTSFRRAFSRTIWYAAFGIAFAGAFAIYMASRGALGDVIYVTKNLTGAHMLEGALPPNVDAFVIPQAKLDAIALAPVAALLVSFAYAAVRVWLRRPFLIADWPMAAVALFLLVYYSKFLARMDLPHAYQPFIVATPLMLYIVYRAVTAAERSIRARLTGASARWIPAHPVGLALVISVAACFWGPLRTQVDGTPAAYRPVVANRPLFAGVGYASRFDGAAFADLRRVVDAYLGPRDRLMDITDEPALFYYLIGRDPSSRWYAPNGIADSAVLQRNVLDQLRRSPPKLIVFDNTNNAMAGLSNMDGVPAMVRLYSVSKWVLDHYRPLLKSHGRTIYALRDVPPVSSLHLRLQQRPATAGVPFLGQACNWGYGPTFLRGPVEPPVNAQAIGARSSETGSGSSIQIALPAGSTWTDYGWVEVDAPRSGFRKADFAISDRHNLYHPAGHMIEFSTLASSPHRYIIPVSNCAQWHAYRSPRLFLMSSRAQPIAGVRLIR